MCTPPTRPWPDTCPRSPAVWWERSARTSSTAHPTELIANTVTSSHARSGASVSTRGRALVAALTAMASNTASAAFTPANTPSDQRLFTGTRNKLVSDGQPDSTPPATTRHHNFPVQPAGLGR